MEHAYSFKQYQILKTLADAGGEKKQADIKPKVTRADREVLVTTGLVASSKQKSLVLALTDQGGAWLAEHPEPPPVVKKAAPRRRPKPAVKEGFPNSAQKLILLRLAFMPTDPPPDGLASELKAKIRQPLEREWIRVEKRGPRKHIELTDAGWAWVESNFATRLVGGTPQNVLSDVLARLKVLLQSKNLRLADLLRAIPRRDDDQQDQQLTETLKLRIRDACLRLAGGEADRPVRVADLRAQLPDVGKESLDRMLRELYVAKPNLIVLHRIDDPEQIRPEDREGAFKTPSGEPRHVVRWVGA